MRPYYVVIPAYKPMKTLSNYVTKLLNHGIKGVIVVNDGSGDEDAPIFDRIENLKSTTVLHHPVNLGKGAALKTAFEYLLDYEDIATYQGIVMADADGQHRVDDVIKVGDKLTDSSALFILGKRDFLLDHVPSRSRFGNLLTSRVFDWLFDLYLSDTQTGLRGISTELLPAMSLIYGDRFEYEMNMLIYIAEHDFPVDGVPIETVYHDEHISHYQTIQDSLKIGLTMLKGYFGCKT